MPADRSASPSSSPSPSPSPLPSPSPSYSPSPSPPPSRARHATSTQPAAISTLRKPGPRLRRAEERERALFHRTVSLLADQKPRASTLRSHVNVLVAPFLSVRHPSQQHSNLAVVFPAAPRTLPLDPRSTHDRHRSTTTTSAHDADHAQLHAHAHSCALPNVPPRSEWQFRSSIPSDLPAADATRLASSRRFVEALDADVATLVEAWRTAWDSAPSTTHPSTRNFAAAAAAAASDADGHGSPFALFKRKWIEHGWHLAHVAWGEHAPTRNAFFHQTCRAWCERRDAVLAGVCGLFALYLLHNCVAGQPGVRLGHRNARPLVRIESDLVELLADVLPELCENVLDDRGGPSASGQAVDVDNATGTTNTTTTAAASNPTTATASQLKLRPSSDVCYIVDSLLGVEPPRRSDPCAAGEDGSDRARLLAVRVHHRSGEEPLREEAKLAKRRYTVARAEDDDDEDDEGDGDDDDDDENAGGGHEGRTSSGSSKRARLNGGGDRVGGGSGGGGSDTRHQAPAAWTASGRRDARGYVTVHVPAPRGSFHVLPPTRLRGLRRRRVEHHVTTRGRVQAERQRDDVAVPVEVAVAEATVGGDGQGDGGGGGGGGDAAAVARGSGEVRLERRPRWGYLETTRGGVAGEGARTEGGRGGPGDGDGGGVEDDRTPRDLVVEGRGVAGGAAVRMGLSRAQLARAMLARKLGLPLVEPEGGLDDAGASRTTSIVGDASGFEESTTTTTWRLEPPPPSRIWSLKPFDQTWWVREAATMRSGEERVHDNDDDDDDDVLAGILEEAEQLCSSHQAYESMAKRMLSSRGEAAAAEDGAAGSEPRGGGPAWWRARPRPRPRRPMLRVDAAHEDAVEGSTTGLAGTGGTTVAAARRVGVEEDEQQGDGDDDDDDDDDDDGDDATLARLILHARAQTAETIRRGRSEQARMREHSVSAR